MDKLEAKISELEDEKKRVENMIQSIMNTSLGLNHPDYSSISNWLAAISIELAEVRKEKNSKINQQSGTYKNLNLLLPFIYTFLFIGLDVILETLNRLTLATKNIPKETVAVLKGQTVRKNASKLSKSEYDALNMMRFDMQELRSAFRDDRNSEFYPYIRAAIETYTQKVRLHYIERGNVGEVRDIQPLSVDLLRHIISIVFPPATRIDITIARKKVNADVDSTKYSTELSTNSGVVVVDGETDITFLYKSVPVFVFEDKEMSITPDGSKIFPINHLAQIGAATKGACEGFKYKMSMESKIFYGIMTSGYRWIIVRRLFRKNEWLQMMSEDELECFDPLNTMNVPLSTEGLDLISLALTSAFKSIRYLVEKIQRARRSYLRFLPENSGGCNGECDDELEPVHRDGTPFTTTNLSKYQSLLLHRKLKAVGIHVV